MKTMCKSLSFALFVDEGTLHKRSIVSWAELLYQIGPQACRCLVMMFAQRL